MNIQPLASSSPGPLITQQPQQVRRLSHGLICRLRRIQDAIFQRMQQNRDLQQSACHRRAQACLQENRNFEHLASTSVSMQKFEFARKLCQTPVRSGYERLPVRQEDMCRTVTSGTMGGIAGIGVTGTLALIFAPQIGGPAMLAAHAFGGWLGAGTGVCAERQAQQRYNDRCRAADFPFSRQTVQHLLQFDIGNRTGSPAIGNFTAIKIVTWLNESGALKCNVYFPEYTTPCGSWRWQSAVVSGEGIPENDCAFRMETIWNRCEGNIRNRLPEQQGTTKIWICRNSKVYLAEVRQLRAEKHIPAEPDQYRAAVDLMTRSYIEWVGSVVEGSELPESNRFSAIAESAVLIPSTSSDLIPLAFPRPLLEEAERPVHRDRLLMQACGVGTLVPSYSLSQDRNGGSYTMNLHFSFQESGDSEPVPYSSIAVARFDELTVKSFATPTFRATGQVNAPNLNELLLQAMYTGMFSPLGMPGDQTVSLGAGRWAAPAERPYPGFYQLWERNPRSMMDYDCRQLTETVSRQLTEEGAHIGLLQGQHRFSEQYHALRREVPDNVPERQDWETYYRFLTAFGSTLPEMDEQEFLTHLQDDLGIIPPVPLDAIDRRIQTNQLPGSFTQEGLQRFAAFAFPGQEMNAQEFVQEESEEDEPTSLLSGWMSALNG